MGEPYHIGDIVAGAITGTPIVVVRVFGKRWEGVALREAKVGPTHTLKGKVMKPEYEGFELRMFEGELTEEEQAAAMMYVLLGGPNNG